MNAVVRHSRSSPPLLSAIEPLLTKRVAFVRAAFTAELHNPPDMLAAALFISNDEALPMSMALATSVWLPT